MTTSLKKVGEFHKKKRMIPSIVKSKIGKHEVVYGARAWNTQLPSYLDVDTKDWDIYSKTPKKDAIQIEKALDKKFGGDYFSVEPAQHKGTWKVKDKIRKEGYVDYTKPEEKVPYHTIKGIKYAKLSYAKARIKKILKDPEAKYRWDKDRDVLNRILLYESMKKKRGKRKTKKRKVKRGKVSSIASKVNFSSIINRL